LGEISRSLVLSLFLGREVSGAVEPDDGLVLSRYLNGVGGRKFGRAGSFVNLDTQKRSGFRFLFFLRKGPDFVFVDM
jgi:hypothetical protein